MACEATSSPALRAASRRGNEFVEQARQDGGLASECAAGRFDEIGAGSG